MRQGVDPATRGAALKRLFSDRRSEHEHLTQVFGALAGGCCGLAWPPPVAGSSLLRLVNTIHAIAGLLGVAMASFHIYLGTIGNKGAYAAMRYGYVDEAWAMEHSDVWYEKVKSGKVREQFADQGGDEVPAQVRTAPLGRQGSGRSEGV